MGAGNPDGLLAICTSLTNHEAVTRSLAVLYAEPGEEFNITFDPKTVAGGVLAQTPLRRPAFLAIASLEHLVMALAASDTRAPDGFIIEHHTLAATMPTPWVPSAQTRKVNRSIASATKPTWRRSALGIPFWLAGGYGSHARLQDGADPWCGAASRSARSLPCPKNQG